MNKSPPKHNQLSIFSQVATYALIAFAFYTSVVNMLNGHVPNPMALYIIGLGFILFLVAKISVFRKGIMFSFGAVHMSQGMGNSYRIGYWLMIVGFMGTFL